MLRAGCAIGCHAVWVGVAAAGGGSPAPPNDPDFPLQWGLHNAGQLIDGIAGEPTADVDAIGAWGVHAGSAPVIVAVVATGVDPHPEFAERLLEGRAFTGDPYDTRDTHGIGTHIAGTIAAATHNGVGMAGINDRVWILPVRVMTTTTPTRDSTAEGIRWAVDQSAGIIVVPVRFAQDSAVLADAVAYAVERDALVIGPVGDAAGQDLLYPSAYASVLCVSPTSNIDALAPESSYGPQVDIAAPGRDVWSTALGGGYGFRTGSSVATGFAAGAAALLRSYDPGLTASEVARLLIDSAEDIGPVGDDDLFGAGRVNARRALDSATPPALRFEHPAPSPATINLLDDPAWRVRIVAAAEQVVAESARVHYRIDGAPLSTVPLTALADSWYGVTIPEWTCDANVEYYFSATGNEGSTVTDPVDAPGITHSAFVTRGEILFEDDFEEDRGWETEAEGADTLGLWTRVAPTATSAQPGFDHSPDDRRMCYVTGQNFGGNAGSNDVDGGPVRLISPVIPAAATDAEIRFSYWFFSSTGVVDTLDVDVSVNGGATWMPTHRLAPSGGWTEMAFRASDYVELDGAALRLRFSVADAPNDSLTEAAIDDFRVTAVRCGGPPGDTNGNGWIDLADMARLTECLTGPEGSAPEARCRAVDVNGDDRVDLADCARLQTAFDGR